jgi:hypothetical protein
MMHKYSLNPSVGQKGDRPVDVANRGIAISRCSRVKGEMAKKTDHREGKRQINECETEAVVQVWPELNKAEARKGGWMKHLLGKRGRSRPTDSRCSISLRRRRQSRWICQGEQLPGQPAIRRTAYMQINVRLDMSANVT